MKVYVNAPARLATVYHIAAMVSNGGGVASDISPSIINFEGHNGLLLSFPYITESAIIDPDKKMLYEDMVTKFGAEYVSQFVLSDEKMYEEIREMCDLVFRRIRMFCEKGEKVEFWNVMHDNPSTEVFMSIFRSVLTNHYHVIDSHTNSDGYYIITVEEGNNGNK